MGYSLYLISKKREIEKSDFDAAMANLSLFNRVGHGGMPPCDILKNNHSVRISGSFSTSGHYVEGVALNLLMCLQALGYRIEVISRDWEYGTDEDFEWLVNQA